MIKLGDQNRSVSETEMNKTSSRSHLIFMLTIYQKNLINDSVRIIFLIVKIIRLNLEDCI